MRRDAPHAPPTPAPVAPGPLLALHRVGVAFGRGGAVQALADVSLHISPGERVALIGANGCGKSTLLRVMHALLPVNAGQMLRAPGLTQAMVFQRPRMLRMSVRNNLALGLWLGGMGWGAARHKALQALHSVGLDALQDRPAHTLSGGQQQRLALARACACQPHMLLLDEPTSSLDPHAKREVEALVHHIAAERPGMTLVFASHNLGQVKRLATRVLYLEQGRVLVDLSVRDFFEGSVLQGICPNASLFVKGELT